MAKLHMCKELFDLIFPIGYIYTSMNSTDPKTLFGYGAWTQIKDEFLYCTTSSNVTGGENTHTLSQEEMPSHMHWMYYNKGGDLGYAMGDVMSANGTAGSGNYGHSSGGDWAVNTGYAGSGKAHNNMPKYRTCYAWYRTA